MQPELRPGEEFAGHRIDRVIGRGGISVVYLAEHLRLGRKVALKVLFPHLADDPGFRDRFIRESRTAAALDHPNIVSVYDAGEVDGLLYLSMRYVEGSDLDRVLRDAGTLDAWRTITIASQVASALDAAHVEGLVHRDVKPGNILLSGPGTSLERAYLADFGITKRMDTREALTRTGQFVGTVDYVAPEQILGQPVDGRTDVYSLGCVLYRCVSGAPPFPRPTDVATIYAHLHDEPEPLAETSVPGLDGVIVRALAKSKEDRYPTCVALVEAARSHLEASDRTQVLERPETQEAPQPRRAGRSGRRGMAAVAGAVALLVGIVAVVTLRDPAGDVLVPSTSPSATTSATPAELVLGPTNTTWFRRTWSSVEEGAASGQVVFNAAAMSASGAIVAAGHVDDPDEDAAVWRLGADDVWSRMTLPGGEGPEDQRVWDLAATGDRIVAVGYRTEDVAAWVSPDGGQTWEAAQVPGEEGSINSVTALGDGSLIAVGSTTDGGVERPSAWRSSDGDSWTPEPGASDAMGEGTPDAVVLVDDVVIAVGRAPGPDGDIDAAIWESRGPGDWTRVERGSLVDVGEEWFLGAAVLGGVVVAVGADGEGNASHGLIWTRDVRGRWTIADFPREADATFLTSVVTVGDRNLLAAGWADRGADRDAAVWWSEDGGTAWTRQDPDSQAAHQLRTPRPEEIRALLTIDARRIFAFGEQVLDPPAEPSHALLWVGDPTG